MLFVSVAGYETVIAPPVVEYRGIPFAVVVSPIAPGDPIQLVVTHCANDPLSADPVSYGIDRDLVNVETRVKVPVPKGSTSIPHGCETVTSKLSLIPMGTPPGHYYLEGTSTARGMFKTSIVSWQSAVFEVK